MPWFLGLVVLMGTVVAKPVWAEGGASYAAVAFSGQAAPGGGVFGSFDRPRLGADGTVGFVERTSESGFQSARSVSSRVFTVNRGETRLVVASGQSAPGTKGTFFSFESLSVARDGRLAFNALAQESEAEPSAGVWVQGDGTLSLPANLFLAIGPASYRSGAFLAFKGREYRGEATVGGFFLATSEGVRTVIREDGLVPGSTLFARQVYGGDAVVDSVASARSSEGAGVQVDSNETGEVALKMRVAASPDGTPAPVQAIYAGPPLAPRLVAKEGDRAPGLPGFLLGDLSDAPSLASNGFVAFGARVYAADQAGSLDVGEGESRSVVFAGAPGAVQPVVRSGDAVPGAPGVVFGDVFSSAVVNETGDVIFKARIDYPNQTSREGIWLQRRSGGPVLIAVSGITLPTPEGPREVSAVDFAGPGTFNDLHQFVFRARFGSDEGVASRDGIYLADTRAVAPWVRVIYPRVPRDRVTQDRFYTIRGTAEDDTGIETVEYSVQREKNGKTRLKARGKARKKKRFTAKSLPRLAKGDRDWEFRVPLAIGDNRIEVVATDRLGNVSEPLVLVIRRY